MPMITLQVVAEPDDDLARRLASTVANLTASVLRKDPAVTAVLVDFVPPRHWFAGGRSADEIAMPAFFLAVRVTDGTNTKEEKARYIDEAFAVLSAALGGAHEESYVHVDDARADAYGYGGQTQERRFIERMAAQRDS